MKKILKKLITFIIVCITMLSFSTIIKADNEKCSLYFDNEAYFHIIKDS